MASIQPWVRVFPPENEYVPPFLDNAGVHNVPANVVSPADYFFLMFPLAFIGEIVRFTNRYAHQFLQNRVPKPHSRMRNWVPTSIPELRRFMAILINMGLCRKRTLSEYWSKRSSQNTPWFRKVMSRDRFFNLLKFFHVANVEELPGRNDPDYRPNMRFLPLLDVFNRRSRMFYTPQQNIAVDETLVASRGRTVLRQYIPTKAAKFGVKFWALAESSTGYIMRLNTYLGKIHEPARQGLQGTNVTIDLLRRSNMLHKGYHVFVDSFFCSIDLASRLLRLGTYVTGTLKSTRPMPRVVKEARLQPGSSIFMRRGRLLAGAYRAANRKKPVRFLSTGTTVSTLNDNKPRPIHLYNINMGGVDQSDSVMSFYSSSRKTIKVWKKVVISLLFRFVLNAYIIYRNNTDARRPLTRLRFIQDLVENLAGDVGERDEHQRENTRRRLRKIPGKLRRDCRVCSNRRCSRARTRWCCSVCHRGVHPTCFGRHVCAC